MRGTLILSLFLALLPSFAVAAESVAIKEWKVPWEQSRPRDPYLAPSGKVWFVGQVGNYIAALDPANESFEKFDLEEGTGPHNLVVGKDGIVWFAGNLKAYIGRFDPKTKTFEKIAMPDPAARDPHTLAFDADENHLWFTVQGGNLIGRLRIADRKVDLIPSKTAGSRPYGILLRDGMPWIVLFGTNKLASIDPETLALTEHSLPRADARPRRIGLTTDGRLWYVDYAKGYLGAFDPQAAKFEEWHTPGGEGARPYGMAVDSRDRIWFVETGPSPNRFIGFDPKTKEFTSGTDISSGGGAVRHMFYDASQGAVWFGTDTNTIGRAKVE